MVKWIQAGFLQKGRMCIMAKVSPSILAADFANLERDIHKVSGAAMLHVDVMDGHFVPNISIGVPVVESIRKCTDMFLDVHLMISHPKQYAEQFCKAGADLVCFHLEAEDDVQETIGLIRSCGKKAAVSIKPQTPVEAVYPFVKDLDMVLVMTVEPGFGGQKFMPDMLDKVKALRAYAQNVNPALDIEVDGGINFETAPQAAAAGANVLVAGSCVFGAEEPGKVVEAFTAL